MIGVYKQGFTLQDEFKVGVPTSSKNREERMVAASSSTIVGPPVRSAQTLWLCHERARIVYG
jgi:hypothetical protein